MGEKGKISVIIVNYNTSGLLYNCLKSICENIVSDYEVIVFDNASSDDSLSRCAEFEKDPRFTFVRSDVNLGFAKANNLAARVASGSVFHFLNPDTEVSKDLDADYMKIIGDPGKVFVNPLRNRDGSLENRPMPLPLLKDIFFWYFCRKKCRVWYKGASVIVPRSLFYEAGCWCEDYFMYAEDLDLFYTFWKMGVPVVRLSSEIYHYGGASSSSRWTGPEREIAVQKSARLFYIKHFSVRQYRLVKIYFLFHYLFKNPERVPGDIRAWIKSKS